MCREINLLTVLIDIMTKSIQSKEKKLVEIEIDLTRVWCHQNLMSLWFDVTILPEGRVHCH